MRDDDIEIHRRGLLYGLGNDKLGLEIERYVDRNNLSQAVCKSQDSVRVGRKRSTRSLSSRTLQTKSQDGDEAILNLMSFFKGLIVKRKL